MSEYPLQSFIALVSFDQGTYALEDEIQKIQKDIDAIQTNKVALQTDLEFAKGAMMSAKKKVDAAELEMKDFEQKEKNKKKKLELSDDPREYQLLSREIKTLKKRQHDHEEILLVAWNTYELAKKDFQTRRTECDVKMAEHQIAEETKKQKIQDLEKDLKGRLGKREEKRKNVPAEWMEKYVLMRSRVSNPVVPVVSGGCSACFYHLPPQDFLALKRSNMLQCKGCYRFLYFEQPQQPEQPQQEEQ